MKKNEAFTRFVLRTVTASVLSVVLLTLGFNGSAAAQSDTSSSSSSAAPAPTCDPVDQANITAVLTADDQAIFTVGNALPLCDPASIGAAIYVKDADGFVVPQTLADSTTDTITSGSKTLAITMPSYGLGPACYYQLDAFVGPVLPEITDTERYNDRLRTSQYGQFSTCIEGESTSTSSSTTTTTAAVSATSEPPTVMGVTITRPAAAPLARTGPAFDVGPLVAASGWLLLIGGTLLALAYGTPRRDA